jgi:hypothetical protein
MNAMLLNEFLKKHPQSQAAGKTRSGLLTRIAATESVSS